MATIVSLHAHPDDEALLIGGWLAQRTTAGDRVLLVFATDGEAGLAAPAYSAPSLGLVRREEATRAARALGVTEVRWLGYADSGMAQAPTQVCGRLADAPVEKLAREIADILDTADADLITGYDANGGYGHPDHLQIHRAARRAQELAARRPRLLEATMDRTWLLRLVRAARPFAPLLPGLTFPGNEIFSERAAVSLTIDVRDQVEAKRAALAAHATQARGGVRTVALLLALPRVVARRILGTEWFVDVP